MSMIKRLKKLLTVAVKLIPQKIAWMDYNL
jgi:hypothetical protein